MAAGDARPVPRKNVAYRVYTVIFDADGDLVSGAAGLDSEVSKDGGNFADCANEATEIQSSGVYYLELTADEMNADAVVVLVKTSTTGAKTTPIILYPEEAGDIRADAVAISGDSAAADNLEAACDGTGYFQAIEGSLDLQEVLRIILAAVAGKASGGGTASIAFRDQADTKNRIVMTVDAAGDRSAVTVDGS